MTEMSKLVKFLPKRDSLLEKLKQEFAPETHGFRPLCPDETRRGIEIVVEEDLMLFQLKRLKFWPKTHPKCIKNVLRDTHKSKFSWGRSHLVSLCPSVCTCVHPSVQKIS